MADDEPWEGDAVMSCKVARMARRAGAGEVVKMRHRDPTLCPDPQGDQGLTADLADLERDLYPLGRQVRRRVCELEADTERGMRGAEVQ